MGAWVVHSLVGAQCASTYAQKRGLPLSYLLLYTTSYFLPFSTLYLLHCYLLPADRVKRSVVCVCELAHRHVTHAR